MSREFKQKNEEELSKDDKLLKEMEEEVTQIHTLSAPTVGKNHTWKQMGPEIICFSCPSQHAFRIGVNKRLKGFDSDGNLIIEKI